MKRKLIQMTKWTYWTLESGKEVFSALTGYFNSGPLYFETNGK